MKVQIFSSSTAEKVELMISEWLENNSLAKIKFITHGEAGEGVHHWLTISIWYEK